MEIAEHFAATLNWPQHLVLLGFALGSKWQLPTLGQGFEENADQLGRGSAHLLADLMVSPQLASPLGIGTSQSYLNCAWLLVPSQAARPGIFERSHARAYCAYCLWRKPQLGFRMAQGLPFRVGSRDQVGQRGSKAKSAGRPIAILLKSGWAGLSTKFVSSGMRTLGTGSTAERSARAQSPPNCRVESG